MQSGNLDPESHELAVKSTYESIRGKGDDADGFND